jgi:bisphosphoglycerate-dependent phosphoglycerate mutase
MPEPSSGRFENVGRKLDEHFGALGDHVEEDVRRVIAFLNDRVVPEVRQNSSVALRAAADQLHRLAEHLDKHSRPQAANPPQNPSGAEPPRQQ